jgi:hypothetical protein
MPTTAQTLPETILALLLAAREAGEPKLTTTALIKFVYLVDYYTAVASGGQIFTGVTWQFLHFGPFDASVASALDELAVKGRVDIQQGGGTSKDYYLYSLGQHRQAKPLSELGVQRDARIQVEQKIREFARDLSALLNFVYYDTEPMQHAEPEQRLDFSLCQQIPYQSVRPLAMKPIAQDKLTAYRTALAVRRDRAKQAPIEWRGEYDDAYYAALRELEGEPVRDPGPTTLHLYARE